MNDAEQVAHHIKYIKGLLVSQKKKKHPDDKDAVVVSPGSWTTDNPWSLTGIDVGETYHITWKAKDGSEINKEQCKVNFSYISALNPVMITKLIAEYERLRDIEKEQQSKGGLA